MENTMLGGQDASPAYDYRVYDQVWQRVSPGVDPFSRDPAAGMTAGGQEPPPAVSGGAVPVAPAARQESGGEGMLPGANPDPCCMGSGARESLEVLEGFIQEELAESRCCRTLAGHTGVPRAAGLLRRAAAEKQAAARELCAAYYLITGRRYAPAVTVEQFQWGNLAEALRSFYHQEACNGLNYARAAEETLDLCLQKLLGRLSERSYRRAEDVMTLLGTLRCC